MPLIQVMRARKEPGLPSIPRMALNAMGSAARSVGQVVSGRPLKAPEAVQASRWAQCEVCEHFRPSDKRCGLCGCFTKGWLVDKVRLAAETCPAKPPKWGAWEEA